jgi:Carboxypeptidase regulatory-like domain/TonB dependent receptor/TonB-dependent Receptor Plug Domain
MMRRLVPVLLFAIGGSLLSTLARAQGVPTGTLSGLITSTDGLSTPGVAVTAESDNLQGKRTGVSSADGHYIIPFLPPGDYLVSFQLAGFETMHERVRIAVSQEATLTVTMQVAPVTQEVTIDDRAPSDFSHDQRLSSSYRQDQLVERLPLDRTLIGTMQLAPGVSSTGPNGTMTISGAPSYESLYLVNGVVVNDNQNGQPNPLFIEDAIQETSVATGALSAEYGRFSGGVVNAITKSGGNRFGGSFRASFTNDAWTALTPFPGDARVDNRVPTYEATLGGPLLTDKLWFFAAGRHADTRNAATTAALTKIPYVTENDENRYEGKLTYTLTPQHVFKASVTKIDLSQRNRATGTFLDLASLSDRTNPQRLLSANYAGVLTRSLFVEVQWSQRHYALVGSGAKFTDLLNGTILYDRQASNARYHTPSSCGVCTTEQRNNFDVLAKGTWFLSTSAGSHEIVFGTDTFNDRRFDNEFPSASTYSIFGTSILVSNGTIYPVLSNDGTTFIRWTPIFTPTQGTNIRTYSGFANDAWRLNGRLSVNLGLRYDKNGGTDSVGHAVVKDSAWSPRIGVTWDANGHGDWILTAGFAKYVAGMLVTVADSSSPGGRAATFDYVYQGPAINTDPASGLVSQNEAIQAVFDWFNANGGTTRATRGAPSVPGLTTVINGSLGSPHVIESTVGVTRRLGTRGAVRVDGIFRTFGNFYADRVDLTTGRVTNSIGQVFDLDVVENSSDLARRYRGLRVQANYRPADRLELGGTYALSVTSGNYNGETFPGGGEANVGADVYPEYTQASWNRPSGDLSTDQRHRARLWATYDLPLASSVGRLSVSALEAIDSGTPYGAVGTIDPRPYVPNPGYINPPASENYYFTGRDAFRTAATTHTDVAMTYAFKVAALRQTELFLRGTTINLFNQQGIANAGAIDQSILTASNSSGLQPFNPFEATPVLGVNWSYGPNFGRPLTRLAYQTPRTYAFSLGVRF